MNPDENGYATETEACVTGSANCVIEGGCVTGTNGCVTDIEDGVTGTKGCVTGTEDCDTLFKDCVTEGCVGK